MHLFYFSVKREADNKQRIFSAAPAVKLFNGEIILPTGEHKTIHEGRKITQPPLYLFTAGPLANGEVKK